jgi:hypothetical protein
MGYARHHDAPQCPSGVAAFVWNQWQLCCGMAGSFAVESVAAFAWNRRQAWHGISGSFRVEYADWLFPSWRESGLLLLSGFPEGLTSRALCILVQQLVSVQPVKTRITPQLVIPSHRQAGETELLHPAGRLHERR